MLYKFTVSKQTFSSYSLRLFSITIFFFLLINPDHQSDHEEKKKTNHNKLESFFLSTLSKWFPNPINIPDKYVTSPFSPFVLVKPSLFLIHLVSLLIIMATNKNSLPLFLELLSCNINNFFKTQI